MCRCCQHIQSTPTLPALCTLFGAGDVYIKLQINYIVSVQTMPAYAENINNAIVAVMKKVCSIHHVLTQHIIERCTGGLRISGSLVARAWIIQFWLLCHAMLKSRNFGSQCRISKLFNVAVMHMNYFAILLQGNCMEHTDCQVVWCCNEEQTAATHRRLQACNAPVASTTAAATVLPPTLSSTFS